MAGYGDDNGFNAWLTAQGLALPDGAPSPAVLRQRGSSYTDGLYGPRYPGSPTGGVAQEREWPRVDAETVYGESIADDVIPSRVIEAAYAAGYYEAHNIGALAASATAGRAVKREKVGSLEREYFEGGDDALTNATPVLAQVEGLLAPLLVATDTPTVLVV